DIWNLCQSYGTVVDVYIPNRRSKAGKRFAFVRFINVDNIKRLIRNLCTLWIGRIHLQANVVRFERSPLQPSRPPSPPKRPAPPTPSYISAAKDNYVMGEVTEFSSINTLRVLLSNEGFSNMRIAYLGGQWVTIELPSATVKDKIMKHVGVASWFNSLSNVEPGFAPRDRIVWADIKGVPMHAWSRNTFRKICSKWGKALDLEESKYDFFACKRICIKTKQEDNILEKFKIIVKGKIYVVRTKEPFIWSPSFTDIVENDYTSDNDAKIDSGVKHYIPVHQVNSGEESEDEAISETIFGENADIVGEANVFAHKESSHDHFNIYDLLHKKSKAVEKEPTSSSIPFPPEMIKVGQTMGFSMDGYANDMEKIIRTQGVDGETKSDNISDMVVKNLWGNSLFEDVVSEANGGKKIDGELLSMCLGLVISCLVSDVQTAFLPNRQILDGPFTLNDLLARCHRKKHQALVFKVDFAKAYDSVQWDYLEDVLISFGFGHKWRSWIHGSIHSSMASILMNGSPYIEFKIHIGLSLNLKKSQLLGVGIPDSTVSLVADMIGCSVLRTPFKYLGIPVGGNMNSIKAWDDIINKIKKRLSNWKLNTLSIGGRLTLFKLVLGSTPLYCMSLYTVLKTVLHSMESIRRNFFNGIREGDRKISWISWPKVLASRENGGLGVPSFYALNRGLLAKWIWRFLSNENSLWVRFIKAAHGDSTHNIAAAYPSPWNTIIKELQILSSMEDRWRWDLNGGGYFHVKDVRSKLDDSLLPKADTPTRWIKTIPIKLNILLGRCL
nr:RNA-directed DNA polymerase, eukaryota [Tanacetum cinerariifolium]